MNSSPLPPRIAITGAAGFLGQRLVECLGQHFPLRLMDVQPISSEWETRIGSVSELDDAMALCEGCSHLVIAHMAPNRPGVYDTPTIPYDVNVKGTANLLHAAHVHGIKRVVLISSTGVVLGHPTGTFLKTDLPGLPGLGAYCLTKLLQENIAEHFHREKGLQISVLRPGYICDEDSVTDKYGTKRPSVNWQFIDPRDIADAVYLSLIHPSLEFEVFYLIGHPDAEQHADIKRTKEFLGWLPKHTFEKYPRDEEIEAI